MSQTDLTSQTNLNREVYYLQHRLVTRQAGRELSACRWSLAGARREGDQRAMADKAPVSRYQALNNEDDSPEESPHSEPSPSIQEVASGGAAIPVGPEVPPPYSTGEEYFFQSDFLLASAPPPYSIATSLPTYDEAEKAAAMATSVANMQGEFPLQTAFSEADRVSVGSDRMFMVAFFVAFLLNWIGFCLSFCLTNTIAGRCGALSGFGLSLVNWIFVIRFLEYFDLYAHGQYWLWWIFLIFGFLLFFRGVVNYLKVRNMPENMVPSSRIRFYFLY
ncbi:NEDD4 family-interacting protein 2 [Brienomyrus brachyistius]|uniref:NEDD4 family-interacting protein 2 n=1 Tax=Brienomyrus brachyistius TaxID=42636 RepID=UPI0020B358CC|nr:NEDD4 family-interacting protein 2 [Brienomyrus brachyistius]XP_048834138.1 NEDD4 family-interacting protein 2 [Brienomyrus brachyistius]XP_048834140.1 NEDD4 family-interacting protein 2 [Brienomyrus brachyistius]